MPSATNRLPTRQYAHPFDRPIKSDSETHGVGRDPDAIGGYRGIGWYETFRDHRTGELFKVHCSDGVYGGKDAHSDKDIEWMESCRHFIIKRTRHAASQEGCNEVRISSAEWALMLNYIFYGWLDQLPVEQDKTVDDTRRQMDHGEIGTINNIPIIVDPDMKCPLSSPPSDQRRGLEVIHAQIDADEDMVEALGY